jgi:hypothetical protein
MLSKAQIFVLKHLLDLGLGRVKGYYLMQSHVAIKQFANYNDDD